MMRLDDINSPLKGKWQSLPQQPTLDSSLLPATSYKLVAKKTGGTDGGEMHSGIPLYGGRPINDSIMNGSSLFHASSFVAPLDRQKNETIPQVDADQQLPLRESGHEQGPSIHDSICAHLYHNCFVNGYYSDLNLRFSKANSIAHLSKLPNESALFKIHRIMAIRSPFLGHALNEMEIHHGTDR